MFHASYDGWRKAGCKVPYIYTPWRNHAEVALFCSPVWSWQVYTWSGKVEEVSWTPRAFLLRGFVGEHEAVHLIAKVTF